MSEIASGTRNASTSAQVARRLVTTFWALLFVVTPLLLPPDLLWAGSATALDGIATFRAVAAWVLVGFGAIVILATRPTMHIADLFRFEGRARPRLPVLLLGCFLALLLLSTFFSNLAPYAPALGWPVRADGTLLEAGWYAMALVAAALSSTEFSRPREVLRLAALGAGATAIWILLQARGLDPLTLLSRSHFYFATPAGAFGHGGVAGAYLAVILVLLATVWSVRRPARWWRFAVFALISAGLIASGGRAGAVGAAVAMLCLAALALRDRRRFGLVLALAVTGLLGGAVGYVAAPHAQSQAGRLERGIAGLGWGASVTHRIIAWKVATRDIAAHPLFGVGPEGFAFSWTQYARPSEQAPLLSETLGFLPAPGSFKIAGGVVLAKNPATGKLQVSPTGWDKAHDYYLDTALTAGLPAALVYLAFLISALVALLRSPSHVARGIGLGLVAFAVWGIAWFPNVSLDPIIWGLVGVGLGLSRREEAPAP